MIKIHRLLAIAVAFCASSSFAQFDKCLDQFPKGVIPVVKEPARALCFDSFAVLYSPVEKKPIYVIEKLNKDRLKNADEVRTDRFYEEARLRPSERALLSDYARSGFDRGHNAPAADMDTPNAMAQSFSLANMMPQAAENNRGIWAKSVEKPTRQYVLRRARGDVFVYTGSHGNAGTIGAGRVVVPTHIFKLVYDQDRGQAWAFWVENTNDARMNPPISYSDLVKRTGIDFGLPLKM